MQFPEVTREEFTRFQPGVTPTHVLIERSLMQLAGGGANGSDYVHTVLKAAGWRHGPMVGYGKHPDLAVQAFNAIRCALLLTQDKDQLLHRLGQNASAS